MTNKEKILLALRDSGANWSSADHLTERTGVRQPARRIHDLKQDGIEIESRYLNAAKGIYGYRLKASERIKQPPAEPEAFPESLFASDTPKPSNAIYGDEAA